MSSSVAEGIKHAKEAVAADNEGEYLKAFNLYKRSLEYFMSAIKYEKQPQVKATLETKAVEYMQRAEQLKKALAADAAKAKNQTASAEGAFVGRLPPVPDIDVEHELGQLIGQTQIKQDLIDLKHSLQLDQRRVQLGFRLSTAFAPQHMLFKGNPGTGKTKIAKLVACVLKQCGVLAHGQLVEVQRSDLVGGHIGETALKTRKVIESAKGGVLFVDEAYRLVKKGAGSGQDFGVEAIEEIMSAMNEGDPIMIFAGYEKEMGDFVDSNAGLFRRIERHFTFDDYTPREIAQILRVMVAKQGFHFAADADVAADDAAAMVVGQLARVIESGTTSWQRERMNGGLAAQVLGRAKRKLDARMTIGSTLEELCTYTIQDMAHATAEIPVPNGGPEEDGSGGGGGGGGSGAAAAAAATHTHMFLREREPPAPPAHVPSRAALEERASQLALALGKGEDKDQDYHPAATPAAQQGEQVVAEAIS